MFYRKLREENIRLKCRVQDLEERLCPCGQHDWVHVDTSYIYDGYGSSEERNFYKCKRCGKEMRR